MARRHSPPAPPGGSGVRPGADRESPSWRGAQIASRHPQDVADGKRLAQETCARCHGAAGVSPAAAVPHLAGQRAPYLHAQLRAYKDGKRPHSAMTMR
jgi:cytochrome c553